MPSNFSHTGFVSNDVFIVAKGDLALATGSLVDSAANAINLADGAIGIVSADYDQLVPYNDFLTATNGPGGAPNTVASCRKIKFVQGTPNSGDLTATGNNPAAHPAFVDGWVIDGRQSLALSAKLARTPSLSAFTLGDVTANSGSINALDETEYTMRIGLTGVRKNREYTLSGMDVSNITYKTPDYTTLGTVNPLDHLVQNFTYQINKRSQLIRLSGLARKTAEKEFIAFAVNIGGGAGTGTGLSTASSTAVVDLLSPSANPVSSIPVLLDNGTTFSVTVTPQLVETFDAIVANSVVTAASTIERIDITTAGAGANADLILVVGVDHTKALAFDDVAEVKVKLNIGLDSKFNNTSILLKEASYPFEGEGDGSRLYVIYQSNDGLNKYTAQNRAMGEEFIKPVSYIDTSKSYNVFIWENMFVDAINYSHNAHHPKRTFILTESGNDTTIAAALEAVATVWADSSPALERKTTDSLATGFFA